MIAIFLNISQYFYTVLSTLLDCAFIFVFAYEILDFLIASSGHPLSFFLRIPLCA